MDNNYLQNLEKEIHSQKPESIFGGSQEDEEQILFMRSKKNVDTLNRAKKLEKSMGGRTK